MPDEGPIVIERLDLLWTQYACNRRVQEMVKCKGSQQQKAPLGAFCKKAVRNGAFPLADYLSCV